MHYHSGTNYRAPRWTFTDPCKPEVRPGAREESASPAWLASPAMNARDTMKMYIWRPHDLNTMEGFNFVGGTNFRGGSDQRIPEPKVNCSLLDLHPLIERNGWRSKSEQLTLGSIWGGGGY